MRGRSMLRVAAIALTGAAALVVLLPPASGQTPPVELPAPPVTTPPIEAPDGTHPVMQIGSPAGSFACAAYGSTSLTADIVAGLIVPLVLAGVSDQLTPPDFHALSQYLRLIGPACGLVPVQITPSGCAPDDVTGAQVAELVQAIVPASLQPFVGVPVPRVGILTDTLAELETFAANGGAPPPGLAKVFNDAFDCHALANDLRVASSGENLLPVTTPAPPPSVTAEASVPSPGPSPSPSLSVSTPSTAVTTPLSGTRPPTELDSEPIAAQRVGRWAWLIVVVALGALAISQLSTLRDER